MAVTQEIFGTVVGATNADAATITAGEALMTGSDTMYIQCGSYTESVTFDQDNIEVIFAAGTTVTGTLTFTGDNVCVLMGPSCTVTGLITVSGTGTSIICENGCSFGPISVSATAVGFLFDGGGWGTVIDSLLDAVNHAFVVIDGASYVTLMNCTVQNTPGGGAKSAVVNNAEYGNIINVKIGDTDNFAIFTDKYALVLGCLVVGSDNHSIYNGDINSRFIGNQVESGAHNDGMHCASAGDNAVVYGNILNCFGDPVFVHPDCENVIYVANRMDGAADDTSGTSTSGGNNTGAF